MNDKTKEIMSEAPEWAKEMMTNLTSSFQFLEEKLDRISERLDIIESQTRKMDSHVDFVENVYTTVKSPLTFVCSSINRISGGSGTNNELPQIEGIHDEQ